jgi:hypothetical protein
MHMVATKQSLSSPKQAFGGRVIQPYGTILSMRDGSEAGRTRHPFFMRLRIETIFMLWLRTKAIFSVML